MHNGLAVYPGTFDPITLGHLNVIKRAAKIFDKVIVLVSINSSKRPAFTIEERVSQVRKVCERFSNVEVDFSDKLVAEYCRDKGAKIMIRGLRALSDFEHECQMANINRKMNPDLDTFFLVADSKYTYLSSTAVKEMARYGADLSEYVPREIIQEIVEKIGNGGKSYAK
jgi:pantetheine-phosphate adenylyltransferase